MRRAAALLLLLAAASACEETTASVAVPGCRSNTDCSVGELGLFSSYLSCGTTGACLPTPDGAACVLQTACGCNGGTETVCLVGGNSPSQISALGSCDGATQQGYDATVPATDASPGGDEAGDSSPPTAPDDSGGGSDAGSEVDSADATSASTLGSPCSSSTDCTSPVYNICRTPPGMTNRICTTSCFVDSDCQPPSNGACDTQTTPGLCILQ